MRMLRGKGLLGTTLGLRISTVNAVTIGTISEFNDDVEYVCTTYLERFDLWMPANGILLPGADDAQARLYISICCVAQSMP